MRNKVLVTGAASGIGKSTAVRFANEGFDVCLNDIQEEKLRAVHAALPSGNHLILEGSYADEKTITRGGELIETNWGRVDVLVNAAGVFRKTDALKMDLIQWRKILDEMLNGCYLMTRLVTGFMKNGGRIVHISSIHGTRAESSASSYSVAKAAINQYCRAMALELADKNILVNAIAPGFVDTGMSVVDGINELDSDWFKNKYVQGENLPLRRAANPDELAGVAFFLAGKDASYITGQVIVVDGGLTITF